MRAAKLGTQIRLPDGRVGTTVFNGLVGVGIKFGLHDPPKIDFAITCGDLFRIVMPPGWRWEPDAYLRYPFQGADIECVGEEFEIIRDGFGDDDARNT